MSALLKRFIFSLLLLIAFPLLRAADPGTGWAYVFTGNMALNGPQALDGTWDHINGSDQWDGSGLGGTFGPGNAPGGVQAVIEGPDAFVRFQDAGNPKDYPIPGAPV